MKQAAEWMSSKNYVKCSGPDKFHFLLQKCYLEGAVQQSIVDIMLWMA